MKELYDCKTPTEVAAWEAAMYAKYDKIDKQNDHLLFWWTVLTVLQVISVILLLIAFV